jgi:hypothetical protein
MRHQRLVGGYNMLAVVKGSVNHPPGDTVGAADKLDDGIDLGIGCHRCGILVPSHRGKIYTAVAAAVARGNRDDDDPAPGPLGKQVSLPVEEPQGTGPDRP